MEEIFAKLASNTALQVGAKLQSNLWNVFFYRILDRQSYLSSEIDEEEAGKFAPKFSRN